MPHPLIIAVFVLAQPTAPPAPVVGSAVAVEDARRNLAARLAGIPITPTESLAKTLNPTADKIDTLLPVARAARAVGNPIVYSDQAIEIHLAIDPVDVRTEVRRLLTEASATTVKIRAVLDALTDAALADRTVAAGFATPPEPDAPATAARRKAAALSAEMATEAALLDARRQLVDRIGDLRTADKRKLEELFSRLPGLEDDLLQSIPITAFGPVRPDAGGTHRVSVTMTSADAVQLLRQSIDRVGGDRLKAPNIKLDPAAPGSVSARGTGVTPSPTVMARLGLAAPPTLTLDANAPTWAFQALIVEGRARVDADPAKRSVAVTQAVGDAEFDARRLLAERIDALTVPGGKTVREILLSRRIDPADVKRFLDGAERYGAADTLPDGRIVVRIRAPLAGLWRLIQSTRN